MFASHVVELSRPTKDGATQRDHWEAAARGGSEAALARLTAPEYPDCVQYLWDWVMELHGRSGVGMSGPAPLSYEAIEAWSRLRGTSPTAQEVLALISLDRALMAGGEAEKKSEPEAEPPEQRKWPTRKPGVEPVFIKDGD